MRWLAAATGNPGNSNNMVKRLFALMLPGILAACATAPQQQAGQQLQSVDELTRWQVSGKMAMRNASDSMTVRFDWQQSGEDYQLVLSGTLGFGSVTVVKQGEYVSLWKGRVNSEKQSIKPATAAAASAEQLLASQTGWNLPISHLRYWALGKPVPTAERQRLVEHPQQEKSPLQGEQPVAENAGIAGFTQDRWQVSYPRSVIVDNYYLPKKMLAQQDELHIIIAIGQWQIADPLSY